MPDFRVTLTRAPDSRDITASVLELRWRLGFAQPYDSLARPAAGQILLDNRDQSFSPELDSSGLLTPGTAVLVECEYDGWQPMFSGVIAHIEPDMGERGPRRALVHVESADAALARVIVRLPVLAGVRADEILEAVLDTPPLDGLPRDFEQGASVFAYAGDQWGGGISARAAIEQAAGAERGRVYISRDGTLVFRSRQSGLASAAPDATFDAVADAAHMTYGADLVNHVCIGLRPRALGAPASTLWTLANSQRLRPGAQINLVVPLRDAQGRRAGAVSVITPVAYTDFSANSLPDGSGSDATASVTITVLALEGSAARLRLENSAATTVYLMPGATLRGTPLLGGQPVVYEDADSASITAYGQHALSLRLPLIDSVDEAAALAGWELARRTQLACVTAFTLSDRVRYADALPLTVFQRVRLIDPHSGHDAVYSIIAEAHTVTLGGYRHVIRYLLEPAPDAAFWTVGVSALGVSTALAV
ncbi:MAG: hypothetical protein IPK52_19940 [Chloroflexi bacterium]|nr:hypothetical protein [Chloroflexota bacterium]